MVSETSDEELPILQLSGAARDEVYMQLDPDEAEKFPGGVDISLLSDASLFCDAEFLGRLLDFCSKEMPGGQLSLAHNDISSGTSSEQRLFDLRNEQTLCEKEKAFHIGKRSASSKEKDFAIAASKKRAAQEQIDIKEARLAEIGSELEELDVQTKGMAWYMFLSELELRPRSSIRYLDLSNCCLHATGVQLLSQVMLEHEHRANSEKITRLILDGNSLGDIGMGALASLLRLSSHLETLQLVNVGITDLGLGELLEGLVSNKSLLLLDIRRNGLCSSETGGVVIAGIRQFNKRVHILFP